MKNTTLTLVMALVSVLAVGFLTLSTTHAIGVSDHSEIIEQRINANLLRVRVNGEWHNVPMVPLSDRLCDSEHQMFRQYCE